MDSRVVTLATQLPGGHSLPPYRCEALHEGCGGAGEEVQEVQEVQGVQEVLGEASHTPEVRRCEVVDRWE